MRREKRHCGCFCLQCIAKTAEDAANSFVFNDSEPFQYHSSKYSLIEGEEPLELPESLKILNQTYKNMTVNNDTHFYNLAVNTNYSSVHVPVNIFDYCKTQHSQFSNSTIPF